MRGKTRRLPHLRLGILMIVLGGLIFAAWLHVSAATSVKMGTAVGNKAPAFALTDLNGREVSLEEVAAKNKVTIINFWGIWCPYCVREIPDFVTFYKQNRNRGVEILGVDVGDRPEKLPSFIKKYQMNYPVLPDKSNSVSNHYGVIGFPTTFIVNQQGIILDVIIGATNLETLKKRVESLLAES